MPKISPAGIDKLIPLRAWTVLLPEKVFVTFLKVITELLLCTKKPLHERRGLTI
jgi:hypothetical protein